MAEEIRKMRQRFGTTAFWAAENTILEEGELGVEKLATGDPRMKIGDGVTAWSSLPYTGVMPEKLLSEYADLAAAVAAIGVSEVGLVIDKDTSLSAPLIIPDNIAVSAVKGPVISGVQPLDIEGPFECGLHKLFSLDLTVTLKKTPMIYPQWWGAEGDGTNDDTVPVDKAAICASVNSSMLAFPNGVYVCSYFKLYSGVIYQGSGYGDTNGALGTVIKLKDGTNSSLVRRGDNRARGWVLQNMYIDGNKANNTAGHGVYLYQADDAVSLFAANDAYGTIRQVVIRECKGSGIFIDGDGQTVNDYYNIRKQLFADMQIRDCDGRGIETTFFSDSMIRRVVISGCKEGSQKHTSGGNFSIVNCKGFYNGINAPNDAGLWLSSCNRVELQYESQEEYGNGLKIADCTNIKIPHYIGDASGFPNTAAKTGLLIENSSNIIGNYNSTSLRAPTFLQSVGLRIKADNFICENIDIRMTVDETTSKFVRELTGTGEIATSNIWVNGVVYNYTDSATKELALSTIDKEICKTSYYHSSNDAHKQIDVTPADGSSSAFIDLFRQTDTAGSCELKIYRGDDSATTDHSFVSGGTQEVRHAKLCQNGGGWNTGCITMGAYYLWIDASDRLRIKSGAPASDTDGTVVGTQS